MAGAEMALLAGGGPWRSDRAALHRYPDSPHATTALRTHHRLTDVATTRPCLWLSCGVPGRICGRPAVTRAGSLLKRAPCGRRVETCGRPFPACPARVSPDERRQRDPVDLPRLLRQGRARGRVLVQPRVEERSDADVHECRHGAVQERLHRDGEARL